MQQPKLVKNKRCIVSKLELLNRLFLIWGRYKPVDFTCKFFSEFIIWKLLYCDVWDIWKWASDADEYIQDDIKVAALKGNCSTARILALLSLLLELDLALTRIISPDLQWICCLLLEIRLSFVHCLFKHIFKLYLWDVYLCTEMRLDTFKLIILICYFHSKLLLIHVILKISNSWIRVRKNLFRIVRLHYWFTRIEFSCHATMEILFAKSRVSCVNKVESGSCSLLLVRSDWISFWKTFIFSYLGIKTTTFTGTWPGFLRLLYIF